VLIARSDGRSTILADIGLISADIIWHRFLSPNIAHCPLIPINSG
jgi:hypothetical protein